MQTQLADIDPLKGIADRIAALPPDDLQRKIYVNLAIGCLYEFGRDEYQEGTHDKKPRAYMKNALEQYKQRQVAQGYGSQESLDALFDPILIELE